MHIKQVLLSLIVVVVIAGCASGISKKEKGMLQTEAINVLN